MIGIKVNSKQFQANYVKNILSKENRSDVKSTSCPMMAHLDWFVGHSSPAADWPPAALTLGEEGGWRGREGGRGRWQKGRVEE